MQLGKSKSTHKVAKRVLRTWACPTQKGRNHEKKAKAAPHEPEVVHIDVNGSTVQILCPASKVSRSDLQVLLHPSHLEPLFQCLTGDCSGKPEDEKDQHTEATEGRKFCVLSKQSANIKVICVWLLCKAKMTDQHHLWGTH